MTEITQAQLEVAYHRAISAYSQRKNVTGIDIGYKYDRKNASSLEQRTTTHSVRIHVVHKIEKSELSLAELFPETIEGVSVDVIESVYKAHASVITPRKRASKASSIQPGISIGHYKKTAGTIGLIVYDNVSRRPCLLSNWHVLVSKTINKTGAPILQPGVSDGGEYPRDVVATLERYIFGQNGDAAIAILKKDYPFQPNQFQSNVVVTKARLPKLGDILEKSGRTTGITRALVDGIGRYFIERDAKRVGIDGFKLVSIQDGNPKNQEISAKGDSGSCWYDPVTAEGVGLHFAGESDPDARAEYALACSLPQILEALNVSLIPSTLEQSDSTVTPTIPAAQLIR